MHYRTGIAATSGWLQSLGGSERLACTWRIQRLQTIFLPQILLSDWAAENLSGPQIFYAAMDAFMTGEFFRAIKVLHAYIARRRWEILCCWPSKVVSKKYNNWQKLAMHNVIAKHAQSCLQYSDKDLVCAACYNVCCHASFVYMHDNTSLCTAFGNELLSLLTCNSVIPMVLLCQVLRVLEE